MILTMLLNHVVAKTCCNNTVGIHMCSLCFSKVFLICLSRQKRAPGEPNWSWRRALTLVTPESSVNGRNLRRAPVGMDETRFEHIVDLPPIPTGARRDLKALFGAMGSPRSSLSPHARDKSCKSEAGEMGKRDKIESSEECQCLRAYVQYPQSSLNNPHHLLKSPGEKHTFQQ